jgi:hypothetical protein
MTSCESSTWIYSSHKENTTDCTHGYSYDFGVFSTTCVRYIFEVHGCNHDILEVHSYICGYNHDSMQNNSSMWMQLLLNWSTSWHVYNLLYVDTDMMTLRKDRSSYVHTFSKDSATYYIITSWKDTVQGPNHGIFSGDSSTWIQALQNGGPDVHMYYTDTIMTAWHTDMNTFRTSWGNPVHGCNHNIIERLQYMKTIITTGFAVLISDGRLHYHSLHISPQTAVVTESSKWVYIK